MPRQARLDAPGTLHHVIIRGIEKKPIVMGDVDRGDFVERMAALALELKSPVYAWALMSNHAHILLRSGPKGLSTLMRRLLTGYAGSFNRRHRRHGHLFQNRYKSIVCDEDTYFIELVRYIHLNPLRANLVESLSSLDKYRWCGHAVLLGNAKQPWLHSDETLSWFGKSVSTARRAYRAYVLEGVSAGRKPELVGGGLVRSQGGWSQVMAMRQRNNRALSDERILGPSDFVEKIIAEADENFQRPFKNRLDAKTADTFVMKACRGSGVHPTELQSGSRRRPVAVLRSKLAVDLVMKHGFPLSKTARLLGVSTPAVSNILRRNS